MKTLYTLLFTALFITQAYPQGCVAIRSSGGMSNTTLHPGNTQGSWIISANNRYFKSFRHFNGTEEQKERLVENTEVINRQYTLDLVLTRVIDNRWSFMVDIPLLANNRSSLYEHGRNERRYTSSFGLGDVRFAINRWLLDPEKSEHGNLQLGLGIKFPTGDDSYEDFWHNVGPDGGRELRSVDQSIQLGDGGTGITLELNGYRQLSETFGIYGNIYYLINPREHNGVRTYRETITDRLANEAIMSVPDQYMGRFGFNYTYTNLVASLGARLEGIPVYDLIGGSGEFRRPGYIWSIEPGISYQVDNVQFFATVPIALVRNRTQSVTDKANSQARGEFVRGDAAFADYAVNFGISFRLSKKAAMPGHDVPQIFNHAEDQD